MDKNIHESAVIGAGTEIGTFSVIGEKCVIGKNCKIGNHVCLEPNVRIGDNCHIFNTVSICSNTFIGNNTVIESGAFIVDKLNQRAFEKVVVKETHIGSNVCVQAKAIIESGASVNDGEVVEYGMILTSDGDKMKM